MNKKQRNIFITGILIILAELIVWFLQGTEIFTKTQELIDKTTALDRMLGVENKQFVNKYTFGLLPSGFSSLKELSSVVTFGFFIILVGGLLIYFYRNKKKETV